MAEDLFGIVGTVIASAYHVEHVVAEGGFGVVYRARHGGFRAPVALKCLKVPQHLAPEQQRRFVEQFRAEGELMFRLSASIANVVRPLHVDVMNTRTGAFVPFMVLEWLEGDTLDALLRARVAAGKRPLPSTEALELLEPVARALARAHDFRGPSGKESIAHCDLKPENVFVARAGGERIVKILDFGIANVRSAATHAARGVGAQPALFTPAYGAPEQWNPQSFGETGPWTDVWGLGLTLSETLVGRPVIAGDHVSMMRQALDPTRRPTPAAHGVVIGDELEAVLTRALACEPRERYPDAGALWRALQQAAARPVEVAQSPAPEIPDLVPVPRRPSGAQKIDVGPRRTPSGARELDIGPARNPSAAQRLDLDAAPRGAAIELGVTGATIRSRAEPPVGRSASGTHKLPDLGLANFDDDSG
ncbi:MAG TPA: serine/threonine-protein kinase, partial [Polyangiaceae bacterium]